MTRKPSPRSALVATIRDARARCAEALEALRPEREAAQAAASAAFTVYASAARAASEAEAKALAAELARDKAIVAAEGELTATSDPRIAESIAILNEVYPRLRFAWAPDAPEVGEVLEMIRAEVRALGELRLEAEPADLGGRLTEGRERIRRAILDRGIWTPVETAARLHLAREAVA